MSNQPEVVNNSEQPFQVVTQKRYSSQSRRGMTRDKTLHNRSQGHSEDSSRKRHTPQHHHLKHERDLRDSRPRQIPRSSHSHNTQRGDSTRGGREGEGHRHRENSWEMEQKGSGGSLEKITSPNRFERLSTAEISNRFHRLNPDTEAPGDPKGGERKTHGHPSRSSVGSRGSRKSSKEEEHVDMLQGDKTEEAKDSPELPANCLEEEAVKHEDGDKVEDEGASVETEKEAKPGGQHFSYSREELFSYRNHPLSLQRPKSLKEEYFRGGKWCAEAWLTPQGDRQDTELPEESKVKHPATLALLREHDPKHLSKVSLSPQRRSFGSGCSWKEMSSSSGTNSSSVPPPSTPPPKQGSFLSEERDELFFEMEGPNVPPQTPSPRLPHPPNYSNFHGPPPPSPHMPSPSSHPPLHPHTPRVIDHVPLRDRERDKRNWRERELTWRQDGYKQKGGGEGEDSEPEWMAFGPTDRNEVIELKGLEEHEREREARKQADQEPSPMEFNENEGQELERSKSNGEKEKDKEEEKEEGEEMEREWEESPKVSESSSVGVEEGVVEEGDGEPITSENEFILDGFDFSTGLSICQDLSADEEEDQQVKVKRPSSPTEFGTALMKALKIKDQQEDNHVLGVDTRPANALTLDEIQARENIHTPLSHPGDQSAFNKLVAQLQFTGGIHHEEKSPAPIQRPPKLSPVHTLPHQQNFPLPQPIRLPPERRGNNNGSFGYLLEKELDFDEELPPTLPPPPSSFLSQQLPLPRGELLNRRGGGAHGQFPLQPQDYDLLPPSGGLIRPVPHRPDPLQEKWMDVYPEKQVEPLRQLDPLYSSSSHRLAASTGGGRLGSTNWAVEMERRRLQELRLMQRERLLSAQAAHHATIPGSHQRPMVSKPSISLLPTAVMRHLHNTKQSEMVSRGSPIMANKLDQDLVTTTSPMHLSLSNMLNRSDIPSLETRDYPLPPAMVSARARAPPPNYTSLQHMMDPTLYPQFMPPLPHGMPAQQHPYMH